MFIIHGKRVHRTISSVQSLSHVQLFATPWTVACQASLSITNSRSLLRLMSIELVMPSNHLILCHPLLILPSIFPSIKVFSSESVLRIRWPSIDIYLIELYGGINDPFIKILFFWCIAESFYIVGKNRKRKLSLTDHFPYTWFLNSLWASLRISGPQLGIHTKRKC